MVKKTLSFEELVVASAVDAALLHLGVAVDVRVREAATFHKKDLHSQQNDSHKQQNKSQNE